MSSSAIWLEKAYRAMEAEHAYRQRQSEGLGISMIGVKGSETEYQTVWTIMPADCNYMYPLVFGGAFMAQLDLAAAGAVNLAVEFSEAATNAVTHKADFEFIKKSYSGDRLYLSAKVIETRHKAIVAEVVATRRIPREKRVVIPFGDVPRSEVIAKARFVFVTINGDDYVNHGLHLED